MTSPEASPLDLSAVYEDLHRHPELAFHEVRTSDVVTAQLEAAGCEVVEELAGTGVAGIIRNGPGPTVLLRADMDALPVREQTGLPYASTVEAVDADGATVPVMHACGHDVHMTCLIGAVDVLQRRRPAWSGTVVALFQPAEETGAGARALVEDGLFDRVPVPDVVLGQHVTAMPAGMIFHRDGPALAASDSVRVLFHGVSAHSARPDLAVDPITMAASFILKVQGLVPRESAVPYRSVLTVGSVQAGQVGNVIPGTAEVRLTLRTYGDAERTRLLDALRRIAAGEALSAGAQTDPEVHLDGSHPRTENDPALMARLVEGFVGAFGAGRVHAVPPMSASEDVMELARAAGAPLGYWFLGGTDPAAFAGTGQDHGWREVPANHSPLFAPAQQPTMNMGVNALVVATLTALHRA